MLGTSFDAIFNPADEQVDAEIQKIAGLYRACPEQGRRLILASTRAMAHELMDTSIGVKRSFEITEPITAVQNLHVIGSASKRLAL